MHLVLQVELFEFKGEDLTDEEDGGIIRRIRARGEGHAKPNDGALVEGEAGQGGVSVGFWCARPGSPVLVVPFSVKRGAEPSS